MAQIARTFDRSLMKSYIFADYLYRVLPKNPRERVDLDKKVRLVNNTIKANEMMHISLDGAKPEIKGENPGAGRKPEDARDLLDNIIAKVNIMFRGEFSEADRVMVEGIFDLIQKSATKKMQKQAVCNDESQFVESIFPDIFSKAAQQCYTTQTDAYRKLFENQEFYQTLMEQMGHAIYERYREQEEKAYTIENLRSRMIPLIREEFVGIAGTSRTLEEAFVDAENIKIAYIIDVQIIVRDMKCVGDILGTEFCWPKEKKIKYKIAFYPISEVMFPKDMKDKCNPRKRSIIGV